MSSMFASTLGSRARRRSRRARSHNIQCNDIISGYCKRPFCALGGSTTKKETSRPPTVPTVAWSRRGGRGAGGRAAGPLPRAGHGPHHSPHSSCEEQNPEVFKFHQYPLSTQEKRRYVVIQTCLRNAAGAHFAQKHPRCSSSVRHTRTQGEEACTSSHNFILYACKESWTAETKQLDGKI